MEQQNYVKCFENYNNSTLIIVDVQKSFSKYFTPAYLDALKKYCKEFSDVYQIWDNHIDGNNVDNDYLYSKHPIIPINGDVYTFPNQKKLIEKRYTYKVDEDFFKEILDDTTYNKIRDKEIHNNLHPGDMYQTKKGT